MAVMPPLREMHADATTPLEMVQRHEQYQEALTKAFKAPVSPPGTHRPNQLDDQQLATLSKSMDPALIESVKSSLAGPDLAKDWTLNNPLSTGLVAFDLEQAAKMIAPRPTPLRNRIARRKGLGTSHRFKRIRGFSGSGTGGAAGAPLRSGLTDATTEQFGPVTYRRGKKISYSADEKIIPYIQFGESDQVDWAAQFSGQSFQDMQQLAQSTLLYSSMLSEERYILGGRGTGAGFAGALPAPTGVTLTKRVAASNEIGNTATIGTLYVYVTALSMWGESAPSTVQTITTLSSGVNVVDVTFPDVTGALAYKVYAGTVSGPSTAFAAAVANSSAAINAAPLPAGTQVPGQPITINFTGAGTGGAPNSGANPPAADSTAAAAEYDGILTYCTGSDSGYVKRLNAPMNTANPGAEFFTAFASMWDSTKADPDEVLCNGYDRKQLSDLLKTTSSQSYQISLINAPGTEGVHDAQVGALVTGLQNEVTGKMVNLTVHPWLPQGTMPIISWALPMPDSNISETFAVYNVQDYMSIQWPVTQYQYEFSTYWYGSLVSYADSYQGCIQGIFKAS